MKNNIQILILALLLLLLLTGFSYAQEKKLETDLVIGASMPELFHVGIRFHYLTNSRLDLNFGSDFNNDDNGRLYAATINHAYYFGKVIRKVKSKLWSINTGFSFLVEETIHLKSTTAFFNLFFAREFPIAKRIFIQPEFGASYFLFEHIVNEDDYVIKGNRILIIPKYGLNLIVKISK